MAQVYWLLKAEPDSRIVKGKDVKFSVDDFESVKTSPWEGVRNYEARNLMKEMKLGDKALFYHSNCKNPGIAAFAEVSKEAYPDYTAWDPSHPYHDPKSDSSSPKWYMVDLTFTSRANHFVSLALLKHIAEHAPSTSSSSSPPQKEEDEEKDSDLPEELAYIGAHGVGAIKDMNLLNRGRLSVQRVQKPAWDAIGLLAERGGWDEGEILGKGKGKGKATGKGKGNKTASAKDKGKEKGKKGSSVVSKTKKRGGRKKKDEDEDEEEEEEEFDEAEAQVNSGREEGDQGDQENNADEEESSKKAKMRNTRSGDRKRKPNEDADSTTKTVKKTRKR